MRVYKAPEHMEENIRIFLAGSIEMGTAEDWQTRLTSALERFEHLTILNPRRDDWDSSWEQSINNPQFHQQVTWEIDMMEAADLIVFYFSPETKSPITLLELGLHAHDQKLLVCCPEGFWRKGNVDMVCERFNIAQVDTLEELIEELQGMLQEIGA